MQSSSNPKPTYRDARHDAPGFAGITLDSVAGVAGGMRVVVRVEATAPLADVVAGGEAVLAHLLRGAALTFEQQRSLDGLGNRNGALDIGDVAAWLDRHPQALPLTQRRRLGFD